MILIAVVMM